MPDRAPFFFAIARGFTNGGNLRKLKLKKNFLNINKYQILFFRYNKNEFKQGKEVIGLVKFLNSGTGRILLLVFIALFLLSFTPFQASAQDEAPALSANMEVWIESSGAGRAELKVLVPQEYIEQGLTVENLLEAMQLPESLEVTRAEDLGGGNWIIAIQWSNIEAFGDTLSQNPDGSYTLKFTDANAFETLTIHIQGNIIQTNGRKTSANTVVFKGVSEGSITFSLGGTPPTRTPPPTGTPPATTPPPGTTQTPQPTPTGGPAPSGGGLSTTWIIVIVLGALFVLAIIVLLVSLSARKRRPPQGGYPYPPPPPPPQAGPAPGYMFCPNCGKQIPKGTKFCTYCGFQIEAPPTPPQPPTPPPESPPPPPETPQS